VTVAYRTWGRLAASADNAVLVCHALTGSADVDAWWGGMLGPGRALDPDHDFVICSNVLGSCYGSTGPASTDPRTGAVFGPDFPPITVRDMVRLQVALLDRLGIDRLRLVIGGSLGGMQALEWALVAPERVAAVVAIATSGRHSPWCIGLSEAQRAAIRADARWRGGRYPPELPPQAGLAAARMMAMCTYRSPQSFAGRFGRSAAPGGQFEAERYLRHHGDKLVRRFDANSYITLTRAMDSHDLGRGRGSFRRALGSIAQATLVVAISSDVLYPPAEQRELARTIPYATLARLPSPHGHDAFLIDVDALDRLVRDFRRDLPARPARVAC
jgi:homoserine O-acetyltransferase